MRTILAIACVALIAGCSSGNDSDSVAGVASSSFGEVAVKSNDVLENKVTRAIYDNLVILLNKIPAPSSNSALSENQIRAVRGAFDKINDATLTLD